MKIELIFSLLRIRIKQVYLKNISTNIMERSSRRKQSEDLELSVYFYCFCKYLYLILIV